MGNNLSPPKPMLNVTVKFVMTGKENITVSVPVNSNVRMLKAAIAEKSEIFPDRQLLIFNDNELRDDETRIVNYGITKDCLITMSVNMNTGVHKQIMGGGGTSIIFYVPVDLPQESRSLRSAVKGMTTVKCKRDNRPKKAEKSADNAQIWTPEKQLEVEFTRNRMKALMRRRNKEKILSPNSLTPTDHGSVIGSRTHSPTQTPPNEPNLSPLPSSYATMPVLSSSEDDLSEVTEKELKVFFEPSETMDQWSRFQRRRYMEPPPQSLKELEQLKKKLSLIEKSTCKACGKKIPPAEQTMRCRCQKLFCRKHRDPRNHQCRIDYKQTGRTKINKWMPKIDGGGARKGKL